jgi:putative salt-induced outer membrane protein YdiY
VTLGSTGTPAIAVGVPTALRFFSLWLAIAMSGVLTASLATAQDATADAKSSLPLWSGAWDPPKENSGGWDWVRLKSNEWVKGEILVMRDFELHFDSDEFDTVEFDWDDVVEIITEREYIIVLQDLKSTHAGTMTMKGDSVRVKVGDQIETLKREQILAITPSNDRELNLWTGKISAGLTLRSGNTEESELSGRAKLSREGRRTRLGFDYTGVYATLDNQKNTNNHRGAAIFDYFLTRDLFLTPVAFEVFTDEFQNVSYRLTPTTGFGYYLVRRSAVEWDVRFGAGYQHVRIDSVVPGDSKTADNGAITFGTTIDAELTSDIDLILNYNLQLIVPDTEQTNHHTEATLELELTSIIDLDLTFVWDRIEDPERESDGSQPDTDDFRLTAGLGIEF